MKKKPIMVGQLRRVKGNPPGTDPRVYVVTSRDSRDAKRWIITYAANTTNNKMIKSSWLSTLIETDELLCDAEAYK